MESRRRKMVGIHADSFEIHRGGAHCLRAVRKKDPGTEYREELGEQLHHKAARPFVGGSGQPLGDPPRLGFFTSRRARNGCHRTLPGKAPAWRRGKNATGLAGQLRPQRGEPRLLPRTLWRASMRVCGWVPVSLSLTSTRPPGGRVDVKLKDTGTHPQTLMEALQSVLGSNLGSPLCGRS